MLVLALCLFTIIIRLHRSTTYVDASCCYTRYYGRPTEYGRALYFCPVVSSFVFFSSPNFSRRTLNVCHTSTHGVALVRISDAGLKRAARGSLKMQNAKSRQKSPSWHHRTTLSGYIFATMAHIDNRKNLLNSNMSLTCPHNMVNFGPVAAEIDPVVWGTSANFNGFRVVAALLHGSQVLGMSQTLRH